MLKKLPIIVVPTLILTACVSNDPRQGGFFGGLMGLNSGTYDSRIQQRNQELSSQERVNQNLKDTSKDLEIEAKARETELASEHQLLDDMNQNLANLESDVNSLSAHSAKQKSEIADLQMKIGNQKRRMKSQGAALKALERAGGGAADPDRYRILQQERKRLLDEYTKLLKYSQVLSDAAR